MHPLIQYFWSKVSKQSMIMISLVLFVFIILIFWCVKKYKHHQYKQKRKAEIDQMCLRIPESETIFVSIPSYRDPQCADTLFDLFEKAACPFRIYVGVCQQNHPIMDRDILTEYKKRVQKHHGVHDFSSQIRVLKMDYTQAKGPVYARALIEQNLYRGEKYYLMIDSHTMFTTHWDQTCIRLWKQCRQWSPKPILTAYPPDFKPYDRVWNQKSESSLGCFLRFKGFHS